MVVHAQTLKMKHSHCLMKINYKKGRKKMITKCIVNRISNKLNEEIINNFLDARKCAQLAFRQLQEKGVR